MKKKLLAFLILVLAAQLLYWLFIPIVGLLSPFGVASQGSYLDRVINEYYDLGDILRALILGPLAGLVILVTGLLMKKFGKKEDVISASKYIYITGIIILSIYALWFVLQ